MHIQFYYETKTPHHPSSASLSSIFNNLSKQKNKTRLSEISVIFVSLDRIKELNREFLGHDRITDIIAFTDTTFNPESDLFHAGDVYICPQVAEINATELNIKIQEELARLIIHGILHILGFDHKTHFGEDDSQKEEMFMLQEDLMRKIHSKESGKNTQQYKEV